MFLEQDKAGTWNTFVPWYADMRKLCKKINTAKDSLVFSMQMTYIAGFGLLMQYGLPYLETGTDWNLTCMLMSLLSISKIAGKPLPEHLQVLTDGGDGNWSVATCCFYGMLVKEGIFKSVTVHRLPPGHTHRKADGYISYMSRFRFGTFCTKGKH